MKVDNYLDKNIYVLISRLSDVFVSEGDSLRINDSQATAYKVGEAGPVDGEYYFGMAISDGSENGPYLDFDKLFRSFPVDEEYFSIFDDVPSYTLGVFAPELDPDFVDDDFEMPDYDPDDVMAEELKNWIPIDDLLHSWGNDTAKGQCVGYVAYLLYQNYGLVNATAGFGNAPTIAQGLGSTGRFTYRPYTSGARPRAGTVVSFSGHIGFVNRVSDEGLWMSDGNISPYAGPGRSHGLIRPNKFWTWGEFFGHWNIVGYAYYNG